MAFGVIGEVDGVGAKEEGCCDGYVGVRSDGSEEGGAFVVVVWTV